MHYYQFNIADYRKDTVHLVPIEHYIYRTLIDWYYLDEQPIPKETQVVIRRLGIDYSLEQNLTNVLSDFFVLSEKGWEHKRINVEIKDYQEQCKKNRLNGKSGGRPKKTQVVSSGLPDETEKNPTVTLTTNQEPLTTNQEPNKKSIVASDAGQPNLDNPKKSSTRGSRLPADWSLPAEWGNWALEQNQAWGNEHVLKIADGFKDYWIAAAGQKGVKADWSATWRNWIRRQLA